MEMRTREGGMIDNKNTIFFAPPTTNLPGSPQNGPPPPAASGARNAGASWMVSTCAPAGRSTCSRPRSAGRWVPRPRRARGRGAHDDASASAASSTSTSRRRSRAAVDLGHCHVRVPRVDAVVDADGAARTLATLTAALAVAPARAVLGVPLAAVRGVARAVRGGGGGTREPQATTPPLVTPCGGLVGEVFDQPAPPPPPPPLPGAPPPGSGPGFRVRGWPWPLAVADALEAGAARLRAGGGAGGGRTLKACDA